MARVIATARGYYKRLRERGEVFDYKLDTKRGEEKLPSWMEPAPDKGVSLPEPEEGKGEGFTANTEEGKGEGFTANTEEGEEAGGGTESPLG